MKGTQIGHWLVEDKLGEGGMGEVWLARHAQISRKVAIKVMTQPLLADRNLQERFVQEASAQARLQHPHIVPVSDFFSANGVNYLVMPYIEGRSLEEALEALSRSNTGPMPVKDALKIAADVLPALDYAHQQLVIHRDVKPSNILLDRSGHAYLVDFGIALMIGQERKTKTGTAVGTSCYMSPDQIRSPKQIDHRTDVYSFGCVLYEMLTGKPPFEAGPEEGDTDFVIKYHHLHSAPRSPRELNPQLPPKIEAVVMKALAKNPDERFVSCGAFARALADADESEKIVINSIVCPHCQYSNPLGNAGSSPTVFCAKCGKPLNPAAVKTKTGVGWKVATGILAGITFFGFIGFLIMLGISGDQISAQRKLFDDQISAQRKLTPVSITEIKLRNENRDNRPIGNYADQFRLSDIRFIHYEITLQNNRVGLESVGGQLLVRYVTPYDTVIRNEKTSPPNFSFAATFTILKNDVTTTNYGRWGNDDRNYHFPVGTHCIEFWWQGKMIGSKRFYVSY